MKLLSLLFLICSVLPSALAQQRPSADTVKQWQSRKYGMFIHFGLFSTLGGVWNGKPYSGNYSEQIESDAHIPGNEYAALAAPFNPVKWDADAIVRLAEEAGMKFIVLTAKHHDGFNMFATQQTSYNVVDSTLAYKRDIVKSLADACQRRGMPFGVYYSSIDWHFGDIPTEKNDNPLSAAHEDFNVAQLRELLTNYGPLSEIWFDMGHPTAPQSRRFAETVHSLQPQCMTSGRIFNSEGDFGETGDDAIPDYITDEPWESPASIFSETWGYRSWQKRVPLEDKIHEHILRLVKVVSRGGNYLLNIGPKGDGSVVDYEADVLHGVGRWLQQNSEAIYDTAPQPFRKLAFGYATTKSNHLYLFVEHLPTDGRLWLPGLENSVISARWLNEQVQGKLQIDHNSVVVSGTRPSEFLPVIDLRLDGDLAVTPPGILPDQRMSNSYTLLANSADRFWNTNGEGYYDPPTLRGERWYVNLKRQGEYKVEVFFKRGPFSRVIDLTVGDQKMKVNLYGNEADSAVAGTVKLLASQGLTVTVAPGSPAPRGAKLDLEITRIRLSYVGGGE